MVQITVEREPVTRQQSILMSDYDSELLLTQSQLEKCFTVLLMYENSHHFLSVLHSLGDEKVSVSKFPRK